MAAGVCGVQAAETGSERVKLGIGFDFSTGKYGSSSSTDVLQIPVTAAYESGPVMLRLTIPYIEVTGPGDVVVGGANGSPVVVIRDGARRTESGIGDITAGAAYNVLDLPESRLLVDLAANVKLPTADETRGLGTGEIDYSFQIDAVTVREEVTFFGTVGYKVFGEPDAFALEDTVFASFGGGYKHASGTVAGLIFDWRQAASPGTQAPFESTVYLSRELYQDLNLSGYILKGWSDGSPDFGFGLSVSWRM